MRIPFINYEIVGHEPMSAPKGDDGQRLPDPTFLQCLTYGGGPLPFKLRGAAVEAAAGVPARGFPL